MKFLIYISQPYSIPIGRPLQKEISSRGYEVKWFCDEISTQKYLSEDEELLQTVQEVKHYHPDTPLAEGVEHFVSWYKQFYKA